MIKLTLKLAALPGKWQVMPGFIKPIPRPGSVGKYSLLSLATLPLAFAAHAENARDHTPAGIMGGQSLMSGIGLNQLLRLFPGQHADRPGVELSVPLYQHLNGPQMESDWSLLLSWEKTLGPR